MTHRREFVAALAAAGSSAVVSRAAGQVVAPRVEARGTVFYGHPAGETTLVRFVAHDVRAPGGRLRVYDRRRTLLATAAMLRRDDTLYGELWLPLDDIGGLVTTLEAPGLDRVLRSTHRIQSGRRWTLHVALLLDPDAVGRELEALPTIKRAVQAALYGHYDARTNPLTSVELLEVADHLPFLQLAKRAHEIEERYGIPRSTLAYAPHFSSLPATTGLVLAEAGIRVVATDHDDSVVLRQTSPAQDAQPLIIPLFPGGTPEDLGFAATREEMRQRVERWLTESPHLLAPDYKHDLALAVHVGAKDSLPAMSAAIDEWNARFAFPRIVLNDAEQIGHDLRDLAAVILPVGVAASHVPDEGEIGQRTFAAATRRASAATRRAHDMVASLAGTLAQGARDLTTVARHVDASVAGTLVFNPSPFPRTDLVRLADGTEQIATDVPELGYAFFPHSRQGGDTWVAGTPTQNVGASYARVRLDPNSGAIASLVAQPLGLELVRPGSVGLNALPRTRLGTVERFDLARIGSRLLATRVTDQGITVRTTVTVYDNLPWVDIENQADAGPQDLLVTRFAFAIEQPIVAWEVPVGFEEAQAPVSACAHLRWLRLTGDRHGVLFRGIDAPYASVNAAGELESQAPARRSRYRIALEPHPSPIGPWRFGWQTEPLLTAPVPPDTFGTLPRFASLLAVDRAGVAALAVKQAEDGRGLIVFLQELLGTERQVSVRPGLLRFGSANVVDFYERDGEPLTVDATGVRIQLRPRGVAAVRLSDVALNRT